MSGMELINLQALEPMTNKRKFRPSNGTDEMVFIDTYCYQCIHEKWIHGQNDNDKKCDILSNMYLLEIDDKDYPMELTYNKEGFPTCTEFKKWDWGNDDDGFNEPPEPDPDDPNQLMLFQPEIDVVKDYMETEIKKQELVKG